MSIFYHHAKFHIPGSNYSFRIMAKPKTKCKFHAVTTLLLYIYKIKVLN